MDGGGEMGLCAHTAVRACRRLRWLPALRAPAPARGCDDAACRGAGRPAVVGAAKTSAAGSRSMKRTAIEVRTSYLPRAEATPRTDDMMCHDDHPPFPPRRCGGALPTRQVIETARRLAQDRRIAVPAQSKGALHGHQLPHRRSRSRRALCPANHAWCRLRRRSDGGAVHRRGACAGQRPGPPAAGSFAPMADIQPAAPAPATPLPTRAMPRRDSSVWAGVSPLIPFRGLQHVLSHRRPGAVRLAAGRNIARWFVAA